jgi:hypothetical protein
MTRTVCQLCGRPRAGGGQRFCWECLGLILSPRPAAPNPSPPLYRYPLPSKRRKRKPKEVKSIR